MKSKLLIKLGAPMLALSLVAACGMGNEGPVENEAPLDPVQEDTNLQDGDGGMMPEEGNLNQDQAPNDNLRDEER